MTVAVVAKSPLHQRVVHNALDNLGYDNVVTATDAEETLKLIEQDEIDVLVADKNLPDMNGFALARLVRSKRVPEDISILLLGDKFTREETVKAINSGVNQLLIKPVHPEDLEEKVKSMRTLRRR